MSSGEQTETKLPSQLRLHHVGFVVASIEDCAEAFALSLGATWDRKIFFDPIQKVRVTFFKGALSGEAQIELVEPGEGASPVSNFLGRGGGLHHLCYQVEDLGAHLAYCKSVRSIVISAPAPAVAFEGRRIAWVLTRKRLLIELLESTRHASVA
jgi:methylmalonyl-CoA/ethylmalonyl-CoA epimerase